MIESRRRINGYLRGCFARGAVFIYWDSGKFSRATRLKNPIGQKHVQRVWPIFRRLSPNWHFEMIRCGRSFRWKVTAKRDGARPAAAGEVTAEQAAAAEIRRRLVGYILGSGHRGETVRVNAWFLGAFSRRSGLPRLEVQRAAESITEIKGKAVRRAGDNENFLLIVSPPHSSLPNSSPSGRKIKIQTTSGSAGCDLRNSRGLRPQHGAQAPETRAGGARNTVASRGLRPLHGGLRPTPFASGGRFVSPRRLVALGFWLARNGLRLEHWDSCRVAWRLPHARNFALRALAEGHASAAIVAAYVVGLRRGHADAIDKGDARREPSATVVYARAELERAAGPGAKWDVFFATDPQKRAAEVLVSKSNAKLRRMNVLSSVVAGVNFSVEGVSMNIETGCRLKKGPARRRCSIEHAPAPRLEPAAVARKVAEILGRQGVDFEAFDSFPWEMKRRIVDRARAELERGAPAAPGDDENLS